MSYIYPPRGFICPVASPYTYTDHSGADIADFLTQGGFPCRCICNVSGSAVDRYDLQVSDPYKLRRLARLLPALETWTGQPVRRVQDAQPGIVALEIGRRQRVPVYLGDCLLSPSWQRSARGVAVVGKGVTGQTVALNIDKAPHVLIAGQTGSGKSVCLNTLICSLLLKNSPDDAEFIFIDPKQVEFARYSALPQAVMVSSTGAALDVLQALCDRMDARYTEMQARGLKDSPYKPVYIVVDELADLMLSAGKIRAAVETCIIRIAQKGRAAGLHLILATQTPRTSVITGLISANIPVKIALTVSNVRESCIILGHGSAEKLQGKGDAIIKTPLSGETRLQVAYLQDSDIDRLVYFWSQ